MDIATKRFFLRWWILIPIVALALLYQQLGAAKPLVAMLLFIGVIWMLIRDYKHLRAEHAVKAAPKTQKAKKVAITPEILQRLSQMQKLGLSVEAMALHAGTSERNL